MQRIIETVRVVFFKMVLVCGMFSWLGGSGALVDSAKADISRTEPNLHDAAVVYGYDASGETGTYTNPEAISVWAFGATEPDTYGDVSFSAYGLYSGNADVNLVNDYAIDVNAVRGTANSSGPSPANTWVGAYGIYDTYAGVNNTGDITVTVAGGTADADGNPDFGNAAYASTSSAYGVYANTGDLINAGEIRMTISGGTADAIGDVAHALTSNIYGLYAHASYVNNAGDIFVTATGGTADAIGDSASASASTVHGIYGRNSDVDNIGDITVAAAGGTADANDADASAAAAYISGLSAFSGNVNNAGDIMVTAIGGAAGTHGAVRSANASTTYVYGLYAYIGTVNNAGDIIVTATGGTAETNKYYARAEASGIYGLYASRDVNNTGNVTVTATGGTAGANSNYANGYASGVYGLYGASRVNNTGSMTVTATGGTADTNTSRASAIAQAFGIFAGNALTNTGDLTITANGGVATADESEADAYACGIRASAGVNNAGDLTVTAGAEDGFTAYAYGIYAYDSVYNSGAITVTATGGTATADDTSTDSYAYGLYMTGYANLTNTGTILTSGDQAYEVYVASGTTTLVDTYNVTLDGNPNDAAFYVASDATLVLNGAALTVTDVNETQWDQAYQLFERKDATSVVGGKFGSVEAVNPDVHAIYHNRGTSSPFDDAVSLSYGPEASETTGSAAVEKQLVSQSMNVVHHRMTSNLLNGVLNPGSAGLLVDAGSTAKSLGLANSAEGENHSGVFVEPYYSRMNQEADPLGYNARLWGFSAGYERQMDDTLISLYAGYGRANIDYTGTGHSNNNEDQDLLTGGLTGLARWDDWTLRYGVTGFYGWHDYRGLTGGGLTETETASIDSYGAIASAMVGHILQRGSHVLLPEVGVNYLWGHRQRYRTEASDPDWDTTFSAMDDHDVEAEAALHWLRGFVHKNIHVTPAASIGIRHLLTDDESLVRQSIPGAAPVSVKSERDRTAMTLSGSILLTKARHSLSLAYDGEYSRDTDRHSVWLRYGWQF